jgi:hypothetical protein
MPRELFAKSDEYKYVMELQFGFYSESSLVELYDEDLTSRPSVITETDFRNNTYVKGEKVVFVLPNAPSAEHFTKSSTQGNLLETARLKMAYTLCGI